MDIPGPEEFAEIESCGGTYKLIKQPDGVAMSISFTGTGAGLLQMGIGLDGNQGRFDVLSWLVLGGLVGLRPYEVLRLEWDGIHFQTREIRIEPPWTKTHRARVIPLQPNALEWLRLIVAHTEDKTEKVMPSESTWNNRWQKWRQDGACALT